MVEIHRVRGNERIGIATVRLGAKIDGWVATGAEVEGCGASADFGGGRRDGGIAGGLLRFALCFATG